MTYDTLWLCQIAIENGPFIVDFPIEHGGSFHSYVNVYQRVINDHPSYIKGQFLSRVV